MALRVHRAAVSPAVHHATHTPSPFHRAKLAPAVALEPVTSVVAQGQREHSCADGQQARGLQVTLLGSGRAGRARAGSGMLGELAPCSPARPPAALPGGLCPHRGAGSCSPALPRRRSLLARHYFYQNFREVPGRSSPGIYLGPLMSRQLRPCQALPAREDKRALLPMGTAPRPRPGSGS